MSKAIKDLKSRKSPGKYSARTELMRAGEESTMDIVRKILEGEDGEGAGEGKRHGNGERE